MSESNVQTEYTIRRKILTLFGAKFHIYNRDGDVIGYSQQKAFRLKEDIQVYNDVSKTSTLMSIKARSIIDFGAAYDITDGRSGTRIGALRRKGFTSFVRDEWVVLDAEETPITSIREDSTSMAMVRRFIPLGNLFPQKYHMGDETDVFADFRTHFNPFVHKLTVSVYKHCPIHPLVVLAAGILLVAIEGRQN